MFSSKKKTGFSKFVASIPNGVWIIISLAAALLLWVVISHTEKGGGDARHGMALEAQEDLITLEPSGVFTSELVFDFK